MIRTRFLFSVFLVLFVASATYADIMTLNSGGATYVNNFDTASSGEGGADGGITLTASNATDMLFKEVWVFRTNNGAVTGTEVLNGGVFTDNGDGSGSMAFTGVRPDIVGGASWDVVIEYRLTESGNGFPQLDYSFSATNNTAFSQNDVSIFNYFDSAIGGFGGEEVSLIVDGSQTKIQSTQGNTVMQRIGDNVSAWDYGAFGDDIIGDIVGALAGGGSLPSPVATIGPVDTVGAMQWDLTIAQGATGTVTGSYFSDIPEPATNVALLLGTIAIAACCFQRRRKK